MFFLKKLAENPKTFATIATALLTTIGLTLWRKFFPKEIHEEIINDEKKVTKKTIKGIYKIVKQYLYDPDKKLTMDRIRQEIFPKAKEIKRIKMVLFKNRENQIVGCIVFRFGEIKEKKDTFAFMGSSTFISKEARGKTSLLWHYTREMVKHVLTNIVCCKIPVWFDVMSIHSYKQTAKNLHGLYPTRTNPIPNNLKTAVKGIIKNAFLSSGFKLVKDKDFYVLKTPFPLIVSPKDLKRIKVLAKTDKNVKFFLEKTGGIVGTQQKNNEKTTIMPNQLFIIWLGFPINLFMSVYNAFYEAMITRNRIANLSFFKNKTTSTNNNSQTIEEKKPETASKLNL
ncbi:MAG: hypothetical protein PVI75_03555 [Gammaproteobacteria bacterium]|jgi:hypothetical protein